MEADYGLGWPFRRRRKPKGMPMRILERSATVLLVTAISDAVFVMLDFLLTWSIAQLQATQYLPRRTSRERSAHKRMREVSYGAYIESDALANDLKPSRLTIATAWVAAREARNRAFERSLFADPAWDMLLDLYISHAQGRRETVTDACIASSVPTTTALRWIGVLESQDLVVRSRDPKDKRRIFLSLTPSGVRKMDEALDAAGASDARLGLGRLCVIR